MYKIIRETLAEMDERQKKFDAAKRRAEDKRLPSAVRWAAEREMWETCLGPAPRRVWVKRRKKLHTHPCG